MYRDFPRGLFGECLISMRELSSENLMGSFIHLDMIDENSKLKFKYQIKEIGFLRLLQIDPSYCAYTESSRT